MTPSGCTIEYNRLPQIAATLQPQVRTVVQGTIARINARAKTSMSGAKHGRSYRRGAIKSRRKADRGQVIGYKFHRASAPGEAPAIDMGALLNSVRSEMTGATEGIVYTNMAYAPALEFGSARMAARPFMTPAAEAERDRHTAEIAAILERA